MGRHAQPGSDGHRSEDVAAPGRRTSQQGVERRDDRSQASRFAEDLERASNTMPGPGRSDVRRDQFGPAEQPARRRPATPRPDAGQPAGGGQPPLANTGTQIPTSTPRRPVPGAPAAPPAGAGRPGPRGAVPRDPAAGRPVVPPAGRRPSAPAPQPARSAARPAPADDDLSSTQAPRTGVMPGWASGPAAPAAPPRPAPAPARQLSAAELAVEMHREVARELAREHATDQDVDQDVDRSDLRYDDRHDDRYDDRYDEDRDDALRSDATPRRAVPPRPPLAAEPAPADRRAPVDDEPVEQTMFGGPEGAVPPLAGGRAALRAQREAAEAERRKSGRKPADAAPAAAAGGRVPRRAVQLVLAMVVVALVALGVWSFTSPDTKEAAASAQTSTSAAPSAATSAPATESAAAAPTTPAPPAAPVRAPVTVLNSTGVKGLATKVGDQFSSAGWTVSGSGNYPGSDIAVTTVYYTDGDATQQQAAAQLVAEFPQVKGPAPRFFDVAGTDAPGLVVVTTGDWKP